MRLTALLLVLALATVGCAFTGKVREGDCTGTLHVSIGVATGPCGLAGKGFSIPGAMVVGEVFKAAGGVAMGLLGRSPVVIENRGTEKQEVEGE